jgi:hypothetical protein
MLKFSDHQIEKAKHLESMNSFVNGPAALTYLEGFQRGSIDSVCGDAAASRFRAAQRLVLSDQPAVTLNHRIARQREQDHQELRR